MGARQIFAVAYNRAATCDPWSKFALDFIITNMRDIQYGLRDAILLKITGLPYYFYRVGFCNLISQP